MGSTKRYTPQAPARHRNKDRDTSTHEDYTRTSQASPRDADQRRPESPGVVLRQAAKSISDGEMDQQLFAKPGKDRARTPMTRKPTSNVAQQLSPPQDQPWSRHKVLTRNRIQKAVAAGWGQGRDEHYHPWYRIRRNVASPVSNLYVLCNPLYRTRPFHLLSGIEFAAANFALWLGATELREQMPVWPETHFHPGTGRAGEDYPIQAAPGMLEIARREGIKHGVYPGTDIPFIHTIDLLAEVNDRRGKRFICIASKPSSKANGPGGSRVKERLHLEAMYANAIGATSCIFTENSIPRELSKNLDWLTPLASEWAEHRSSSLLRDFADEFMLQADNAPLRECRIHAARKTKLIDNELQHNLFRMAAWAGMIDIDLTQPIIFDRYMRRDQSKKRLAQEILGVDL